MVQPSTLALPLWQCGASEGAANKPYLVFRWNSLTAQKDGTPWLEGTKLTFEACTSGLISYTEDAQASAHRHS